LNNPIMHDPRTIIDRFREPKQIGEGEYMAFCDAHPDGATSGRRSLHITATSDKLLLRCFNGCPPQDIVEAVGLQMADLFAQPITPYGEHPGYDATPTTETSLEEFCRRRKLDRAYLETVWRVREGYHQGRKALLFPTSLGVDRVKFLDRGNPKTTWAAKGGSANWYGLDFARKRGGILHIVNGEPSVWAAAQEGVAATCMCIGEGQVPNREMIEALKEQGFDSVAIVYDRDETGRKGALRVRRVLREAGIAARVLALPEWVGDKGDVDDLHRTVGEDLAGTLAGLPELPQEVGPGDLMVTRLSDVPPEEVSWLWEPLIPRGKLTIMCGDPGDGKTSLAIAIAAAITNGAALPLGDTPDGPGSVLLAIYEDGLGDTIRPRADAMGAQTERMLVIQGVQGSDGHLRPFHASDIHKLDDVLDAVPNIQLLIVDPVASLIGGRTDTSRDNEVRDALQPLVALAERRRVAVVGIMHLRKSEAQRAIYRVNGAGFVGVARSVLLVAQDPETKRRAVVQIKNNLAEFAPPLEFSISDRGVTWLGEAPELSVERLLGPAPSAGHTGELDGAIRWLGEALGDGPQPASDMIAEAEAQGIAKRTLDRAKGKLGVLATQERGDGGIARWVWALPQVATREDAGNVGNVGNVGDLGNVGGLDPPDTLHRQECQGRQAAADGDLGGKQGEATSRRRTGAGGILSNEARWCLERMRQKLDQRAAAIRQEQHRAGIGVMEHTPESRRLQEMYDRLERIYAEKLDEIGAFDWSPDIGQLLKGCASDGRETYAA